jgi:small nuclear ribonucleoprotein (snRNP)-like protein
VSDQSGGKVSNYFDRLNTVLDAAIAADREVTVTTDGGNEFTGKVVDYDDNVIMLERSSREMTASHMIERIGIAAVSTYIEHDPKPSAKSDGRRDS